MSLSERMERAQGPSASVTSNASYARKLNLPFPLLTDEDRAIAGAYRALKPDEHGIQRTV